jgi:hypothetical protein
MTGGAWLATVRPVTGGSAGYSGKSIAAKLGIGAGRRVLVVGQPTSVDLGDLRGAAVHTRRSGDGYDVVVAFTPDQRALTLRFGALVPALAPAGALWICWPKKASGVATDLSEGGVRMHGLDGGLVDVKIAAIDPVWSALKFVRRLADR